MYQNIPEKLLYSLQVKDLIDAKLNYTNQNTNVPFNTFPNLIKNIPNTSAISPETYNALVIQTDAISGEKA